MHSGCRAEPFDPVARRDEAPRVLFVTHTGQVGGAETCLLSVAPAFAGGVLMFDDGPLRARLSDSGMQVDLAEPTVDLRAVRRDRGLLGVLPQAVGVGRLLLHIRRRMAHHDLIYCNSQKGFVLGALATLLHSRPLVWHLHDILESSHFAAPQIRLVVNLANWRASLVLAPSQAVADAFVRAGGRASLVRIVPNGVSAPPDYAASPSVASERRRQGLPEGFLFGVFSRLAPWKGQHVALEALARVPDAACIIVGGALFGEEDYEAALKQRALQLGVATRVHFLGHRQDARDLMRLVDVVVHPSIDPEPFGLTLVEAMLAGVPLVASKAGAAVEILDQGRLGTLTAPGSAEALAEAVAGCHEPSEALVRRTWAAREHAALHYSVERMRRAVATLLGEIARPSAASWPEARA